LLPGFYHISYQVETKAIVPDWVLKKNATEVQDFIDSHAAGEPIKVLKFKNIYETIVNSYNSIESHPSWSGEFYLLTRNWLNLIIAIVLFLLVVGAIIFIIKFYWYKRLIRGVFDLEIRMKNKDLCDSMPILIGRCTIEPEKIKLVKTKFTLKELSEKARNIGEETKQAGFYVKIIDDKRSNGELLQISESNKEFLSCSFEGRKGWFIVKMYGKKTKSFIHENDISLSVEDVYLNIEYEFRLVKAI
jgi:hypothetical protein